jgi:hypothetical protein
MPSIAWERASSVVLTAVFLLKLRRYRASRKAIRGKSRNEEREDFD